MLKNLFLNTSAIRYDANNDQGQDDKSDVEKAREAIAKNTVTAQKEEDKSDPEGTKDGDEEDKSGEEDGDEDDEEKVEETAEAKSAREAKETETDKEKRKQERIQKRIDKAVAGQRAAEAEVVKLREQLAANPDKTLTEEEIQRRADAIANEKVAAKELERAQVDFNKACDKLQDAAVKLDKEFTPKVVAMADELGPIPSRVIGILDDLDNGAEVLKFMVDDIDEAEKIYDLKDKPERLAIALVRISDKLAAAKKPAPRQISKVPDPPEQVNGSRVRSSTITGKESTEEYIRKRTQQREELKKQRGY